MEHIKTATMNISLPPELVRFVRQKVESGTYASASEVIREALRFFFAQGRNGAAPEIVPHAGSGEIHEARIDRAKSRKAIDTLLKLRKGSKLGRGVEVRDLIDKGRP